MEELATLVLLNENVEREIRWMLKRRAELQEGYGNQAVGDQKHHITEAALKLDGMLILIKIMMMCAVSFLGQTVASDLIWWYRYHD